MNYTPINIIACLFSAYVALFFASQKRREGKEEYVTDILACLIFLAAAVLQAIGI